jgi:hypothetical protein
MLIQFRSAGNQLVHDEDKRIRITKTDMMRWMGAHMDNVAATFPVVSMWLRGIERPPRQDQVDAVDIGFTCISYGSKFMSIRRRGIEVIHICSPVFVSFAWTYVVDTY